VILQPDSGFSAQCFEDWYREPDNIEITPVDAIDKEGSIALDGISPGFVTVLRRIEIPFNVRFGNPPEMNPGDRKTRAGAFFAAVEKAQPGEDFVPVTAETGEHVSCFRPGSGLPEQAIPQDDNGVGPDDYSGVVFSPRRFCL